MPGAVFIGRAHVEAVGRAAGVGEPLRKRSAVDPLNPGAIGDRPRRTPRVRVLPRRRCRRPTGLTVLECQAVQRPADGAVAQGHHPVCYTGVDERLRTDDAAGTAGAVDDDQRLGGWRRGANATNKLCTWRADAARYAHRPVLVLAPRVEHYQVRVLVQ